MAEETATKSEEFDEKTLKNAEFCLSKCPPCVKGREKGKGFWFQLLKIERLVCPKCKAYEKVYGVKVWDKPPQPE